MKQIGIIMSGDHPLKCMDGTKTMTRRVIKPQPETNGRIWIWKRTAWDKSKVQISDLSPLDKCPYQVGDRLWVRETWASLCRYDDLSPSEIPQIATRYYLAGLDGGVFGMGKRRPSIFMPRWASRITLEITEVRVERVQEISEEDAEAEGIKQLHFTTGMRVNCTPQFIELWDSLNAKRGYGWDTNCWVWVLSFKLVEERA